MAHHFEQKLNLLKSAKWSAPYCTAGAPRQALAVIPEAYPNTASEGNEAFRPEGFKNLTQRYKPWWHSLGGPRQVGW